MFMHQGQDKVMEGLEYKAKEFANLTNNGKP